MNYGKSLSNSWMIERKYLFNNFPNTFVLPKTFIETIIENKSKFMTQIIKSIKPRIAHLICDISFKTKDSIMLCMTRLFLSNKRHIDQTQTDFLLFIHRKANKKY